MWKIKQTFAKDLQSEVEHYIELDEEARAMLNRKENMRTLLEQANTKLHKTEEQIAHLRWSFNKSLCKWHWWKMWKIKIKKKWYYYKNLLYFTKCEMQNFKF